MSATKTETQRGPLDLNLVSTFVRVMETGSFTAAAQELGLPKSSISRRVSALEAALRVRLLQRSTRKLVLTEAGRAYFARVKVALGTLVDASAAVTELSGEIAGPIRFTAGGDNTGLIASLMAEFLARYPKVQIEVVLTPRRVDLVAEGFDSSGCGPEPSSTRRSSPPDWAGSSSASLRQQPTCASTGGPRASPTWPSTASSSSARPRSAASSGSPDQTARSP